MTSIAARRNHVFRRALAVGAATALGWTAAMASAPASAAGLDSVSGYQIVSAVSANDSISPKSVTVACPSGKQLIGTGYVINGATGEVVVDVLRPNGNATTAPTSVYLRAAEEDAYSGNWNVRAYAICSFPISGLVRVKADSASNSNDYHSVSAACPSGMQLLGTGYEVSGPSGEVVLDDFRPNGSATVAPTSVYAGAYEADPDYAGIWTLTAYGICAFPIDGLVRVSVSGASNSSDFHGTTATCPSGDVLTGAGFEMNGVTGEGVVDDFVTVSTYTRSGAYEADPDYTGNWSLIAYAICAVA